MSTNSIVAVPQGDAWRGRFCHWDGSPSSMLRNLQKIIRRDGLDVALPLLTSRTWSTINPGQHADGDDHLGDRGENVVGYGVRHTDKQEGSGDWITSDGDGWGTAWAYVIYPKHITVLGSTGDSTWELSAVVEHHVDLSDDDYRVIECGQNYEHCSHYAWVHFPEAEGTRYNTGEWIAESPAPSLDNASAVLLGDERFAFGGSGGIAFADGSKAYLDPNWHSSGRPIYWSTSIQKADGSSAGDLVIGRRTKAGLKLKYPIVLPPNGVRGEVVIPAGEVVQQ